MRLARFHTPDGPHAGVVLTDDTLVDLSVADPSLDGDLVALLSGGPELLEQVEAAASSGKGRLPLDLQALLPPVVGPEKIFGIGLNYADHIAEAGLEPPAYPTVFTKYASSITGPFADVERPTASDQLDYEGELAFVIGATGRHVPREKAAG